MSETNQCKCWFLLKKKCKRKWQMGYKKKRKKTYAWEGVTGYIKIEEK